MQTPLWTDEDTDPALDSVADLVKAGNRIGVVYELHNQTGAGLRAVEAAVETLADKLAPASLPDGPCPAVDFSAPPAGA